MDDIHTSTTIVYIVIIIIMNIMIIMMSSSSSSLSSSWNITQSKHEDQGRQRWRRGADKQTADKNMHIVICTYCNNWKYDRADTCDMWSSCEKIEHVLRKLREQVLTSKFIPLWWSHHCFNWSQRNINSLRSESGVCREQSCCVVTELKVHPTEEEEEWPNSNCELLHSRMAYYTALLCPILHDNLLDFSHTSWGFYPFVGRGWWHFWILWKTQWGGALWIYLWLLQCW